MLRRSYRSGAMKKHFYQAQLSAQVRMITFFSRVRTGAVQEKIAISLTKLIAILYFRHFHKANP
jgi:hypothetical protein